MGILSQEKTPLVLVVDDDSRNRKLISIPIKRAGFNVEEAEDGWQALSLFEKVKPNIVLLDVLMPGMDGFEVCKTIRQLPEAEYVPIVMITGLNDTDSINCAYEAGATDFITKPFNLTILMHRLKYIYRTSQERMRCLASKLCLAEEKERRRLSADLHDHIGQTLAVAQMKLGAIQHEVSSSEGLGAIREVRDLINHAIHYSRSLIFELGSTVLHDLGLEEAIEWLAEEFQKRHNLPITVSRDGHIRPLADNVMVLVFLAFRELLNIVMRYFQASAVEVYLRNEGDNLLIQVKYNGDGYDIDEIESFNSEVEFSLFSIKERLSYIRSRLKVTSAPGKEPEFTIMVPTKLQNC
jgi:signal transduction histidine kinase